MLARGGVAVIADRDPVIVDTEDLREYEGGPDSTGLIVGSAMAVPVPVPTPLTAELALKSNPWKLPSVPTKKPTTKPLLLMPWALTIFGPEGALIVVTLNPFKMKPGVAVPAALVY